MNPEFVWAVIQEVEAENELPGAVRERLAEEAGSDNSSALAVVGALRKIMAFMGHAEPDIPAHERLPLIEREAIRRGWMEPTPGDEWKT